MSREVRKSQLLQHDQYIHLASPFLINRIERNSPFGSLNTTGSFTLFTKEALRLYCVWIGLLSGHFSVSYFKFLLSLNICLYLAFLWIKKIIQGVKDCAKIQLLVKLNVQLQELSFTPNIPGPRKNGSFKKFQTY